MSKEIRLTGLLVLIAGLLASATLVTRQQLYSNRAFESLQSATCSDLTKTNLDGSPVNESSIVPGQHLVFSAQGTAPGTVTFTPNINGVNGLPITSTLDTAFKTTYDWIIGTTGTHTLTRTYTTAPTPSPTIIPGIDWGCPDYSYLENFGSLGIGLGKFRYIDDVFVDNQGYVYVAGYNPFVSTAEDSDIQKWDQNTRTWTILVDADSSNFTDPKPLKPISLYIPTNSTELYVADEHNNNIKVFHKDTGAFIRKITNPVFTSYPKKIAVMPNGDIVATMFQHHVIKLDSSGNLLFDLQPIAGVGETSGIDIDSSGTIFVANDNGTIYKLPLGATVFQKFVTPPTLSRPSSIRIDPANNVWVVDYPNANIRKFSPSGNLLATFGSFGTGPDQFTYAVGGSLAGSPSGIGIGPGGGIFVGDYIGGKVIKFACSALLSPTPTPVPPITPNPSTSCTDTFTVVSGPSVTPIPTITPPPTPTPTPNIPINAVTGLTDCYYWRTSEYKNSCQAAGGDDLDCSSFAFNAERYAGSSTDKFSRTINNLGNNMLPINTRFYLSSTVAWADFPFSRYIPYGTFDAANPAGFANSNIRAFIHSINPAKISTGNTLLGSYSPAWGTDHGTFLGPDTALSSSEIRLSRFTSAINEPGLFDITVVAEKNAMPDYRSKYAICARTLQFCVNPANDSTYCENNLQLQQIDSRLNFKVRLQGVNPSTSLPAKDIRVALRQPNQPDRVFLVTAQPDTQGLYVYSGSDISVPAGTYDVLIKGPVHLQKKIADITLNEQLVTADFSAPALELKAGDIAGNGNNFPYDNSVDLLDYGVLASAFSSGTPKTSIADLNFDGFVDLLDYGLLANNFNSGVFGDQ